LQLDMYWPISSVCVGHSKNACRKSDWALGVKALVDAKHKNPFS